MNQVNSNLKEKLKTVPQNPGVYLMMDLAGQVIYVGKAKNLKNRLRTYFQKNQSLKTMRLVDEVEDFSLFIVFGEVEALLLERNLIKKHQPKYNILLRDDKEYPLIRIDRDELWPRFTKVRRKKKDQALYLGPYPDSAHLSRVMGMLYDIFPLIRCSVYEFQKAKKPCQYFYMKKCMAPCVGKIDSETYRTVVLDGISFLEKKNHILIKDIETKMWTASQNEDFEMAAFYRNQLEAIRSIQKEQHVIYDGVGDLDSFAFYEKDGGLCLGVLHVRDHVLIGKDHWIFEDTVEEKEDLLEGVLFQYYEGRPPPRRILLPFEVHWQNVLPQALGVENATIETARTPELKKILDLTGMNAKQVLEEKTFRMRSAYTVLEEIKRDLKLPRLPKRMECIDISNFQNTGIAASSVCFIDGKPKKNFYRRYSVTSLSDHHNDGAAIFEIVQRRCKRAQEEGVSPDLLLIDGGKIQLGAALRAKESYPGLDFEIRAIAKKKILPDPTAVSLGYTEERIFFPGVPQAIPLKEGSQSYRVLTHLRDEAHRFALAYHRKKRGAKFLKT
jgi:excinuclease ABC subunit C